MVLFLQIFSDPLLLSNFFLNLQNLSLKDSSVVLMVYPFLKLRVLLLEHLDLNSIRLYLLLHYWDRRYFVFLGVEVSKKPALHLLYQRVHSTQTLSCWSNRGFLEKVLVS